MTGTTMAPSERTPTRWIGHALIAVALLLSSLGGVGETLTEQATRELTKAGASVGFWLEKNQGHIMATLAGEGSIRLFLHFEEARRGCER